MPSGFFMFMYIFILVLQATSAPLFIYMMIKWNPVHFDYNINIVLVSSIPMAIEFKVNLTLTVAIALDRCLAIFKPIWYRAHFTARYAHGSIMIGVFFGLFDCAMGQILSKEGRPPASDCGAPGCFTTPKYRYYTGVSNMCMGVTVTILTMAIIIKLNFNKEEHKRNREGRLFKQTNRVTSAILTSSIIFFTIPSILVGASGIIGEDGMLFRQLGPFYVIGLLASGICNGLIFLTINPEVRRLAKLILFNSATIRSESKASIWRHGDRAPGELPYPNDKNGLEAWPRGWNQMTNRGIKQAAQLGKWLKRRYGKGDGAILRVFNKSKIYFQSSDSERAIETSQAVAATLFKPRGNRIWTDSSDLENWQPTPIHTTAIGYDPLLRPSKFPCPLYDKIEDEEAAPKIAKINQDYAEMFRNLSAVTGIANVSFKNIGDLYDVTREIINNLKPDEWIKYEFNGSSYLTHVIELKRISDAMEFDTKEKAKLGAGYLVNNWLNHMEKAASGKSSLRAVLYSSHDGTVSAFLSALGVSNNLLVPYTGTVLAELHDDQTVQFFYRNNTNLNPFPLQIPGCSQACPLPQLLDLLEDVRIGTSDEYTQLCKIKGAADAA
ncbi:unnamed protein product [Caenorhabditis auriculariae]|uniref:Uncharacterized protein n=1 Tax=Caenorhabditis auriculariae TaxID=2777116 RepID=A0A8S1HA75_9PELO|nr:unnamed protein product [Caenorhabditis auriculariae]